jgi:hypothetical protein
MRSALIWAILLTAVTVSAPCGAEASTPLTNRDVIDMVAAGLPESTILLSIKQSPAGFSTSPQDLIALKKAGVSPAVMDAMMKAGAGAGSSAATGGTDALVPSAYGQYAVAAGKLQALPTTPVDLVFGIKLVDGGVAADGFKSDREATVIEDLNPKFFVYAHQLDPRQVKLARLKLVETMTAWQFNVRGSDPGPFQAIYGVSPNKVIDVNLLRAAEPIGLAIEPVVGRAGMYRFTLQRPLQRGEHYALYMGDALHDIEYLVTEKLNRAPVHAVLFKTPGGPSASGSSSNAAANDNQSAGYRNCVSLGTPPESCATLYPPTSGGGGTAAGTSAGESPAASTATTPIVGTWSGRIRSGMIGSDVVISVKPAAVGAVAGRADYINYLVPSDSPLHLYCSSELTLREAKPGSYTFQERMIDAGSRSICPIRDLIRLSLTEGASVAEAQWARSGSPDKASYRGTLHKK